MTVGPTGRWRGRAHLAWFALVALIGVGAVLRPAIGSETDPLARASAPDEAFSRFESGLGWASVPGASVAVASGSGVKAWQTGSRTALGSGAVGPRTRFEAASLSKPLTAYAVLRLARAGKLDLDAPVRSGGHVFTLRQVLSHSAGFGNAMAGDPVPEGPAGRFRYAGDGYLFLGKAIEAATGQTFADYMNRVVLPELGMSDSSFGSSTVNAGSLAMPSIDLGLPFAMAALTSLVAGIVLHSALGVAGLIRRRQGKELGRGWRAMASTVAVGLGLAAIWKLFGATNLLVLGGACAAVFAGFAAAAWLFARPGAGMRILAGLLVCVLICLLALRPALPLVERRPMFLPAAGLRTTASDYARFLSVVLREARADPAIARMVDAQVRAGDQSDWGLGLGVARGAPRTAWHWGVNFPGYQSLAVANLETGQVTVVLMNGGSLSPGAGGMRYSGLERAQALVEDLEGRRLGPLWREVQ